jgi:hypothetical protein
MTAATLPPQLFGAWRLEAFEDRGSVDEAWAPTLGPDAHGLLVCVAPDVIAVQIQAPSAPGVEGPLYVGYFGRATAHDLGGSGERVTGVLHLDLDGGHPPEALADAEPRPFEVLGNTLVLGDQRLWRRRLSRIRG